MNETANEERSSVADAMNDAARSTGSNPAYRLVWAVRDLLLAVAGAANEGVDVAELAGRAAQEIEEGMAAARGVLSTMDSVPPDQRQPEDSLSLMLELVSIDALDLCTVLGAAQLRQPDADVRAVALAVTRLHCTGMALRNKLCQ